MGTKKKQKKNGEKKRSGCKTCSDVAAVNEVSSIVVMPNEQIVTLVPGCEMQYITYAQLQLAVDALEANFAAQIAPLREQLELARAAYLDCAMTV